MHHPFHIGKYLLPGILVILAVIFIDQYSKWLMIETVARVNGPVSTGFFEWLTTVKKIEFFVNEREHFTYRVITPFLNLVMVWNQGISFGLFNSTSPQVALGFIALSLLISIFMLIWLAVSHEKLVAYALSLVVGGALGNVIDRVRFDAVEDFIDLHWEGYHWPAFNVADMCIVFGAVLLMIHSFRGKKKA